MNTAYQRGRDDGGGDNRNHSGGVAAGLAGVGGYGDAGIMAMVELLVGQLKEKETRRAIQACNDYLRMGPGRSLQKLYQNYAESIPEKPPTKNLLTLKHWSRLYGWQNRAADYDAIVDKEKTALIERRKRDALETGLALDYERVVKLKELASFLLDEINESNEEGKRDKVWLPDVKQIGSGESAERVDIVRFNSAIFEQFRGLLDDLAKETGGRKANASITNLNVDLSTLTDAQLQRIAAGEDPISVFATTESGG